MLIACRVSPSQKAVPLLCLLRGLGSRVSGFGFWVVGFRVGGDGFVMGFWDAGIWDGQGGDERGAQLLLCLRLLEGEMNLNP